MQFDDPAVELTIDDVPPSAFTWSSLSGSVRAARSARLGDPYGVWTAAGVGSRVPEYLQVALDAPDTAHRCVVLRVATQGHPDHAGHVSRYHLELSRDFHVWTRHPAAGCFQGHHDARQAALGAGVEARAIRFVVDEFVSAPSLRVGVWFVRERAPAVGGLLRALGGMVNADKYADVDVVVRAGGQRMTVRAHRAVLAARSVFFREAIARAVREQRDPRVLTLYIDDVEVVGDADPRARAPDVPCRLACEVVVAVLRYLYTAAPPPAHLAYAVARAATTLHVPELADACTEALFDQAARETTCVAAYISATREIRSDVARYALATILQHWDTLHRGFPWDALDQEQTAGLLSALESRRTADPRASPVHLSDAVPPRRTTHLSVAPYGHP